MTWLKHVRRELRVARLHAYAVHEMSQHVNVLFHFLYVAESEHVRQRALATHAQTQVNITAVGKQAVRILSCVNGL